MRFLRLNVLISTLLPTVFAACGSNLFPNNADVCNVGPDSTASLETLVIVNESATGQCQALFAINGDQVYQYGRVIYTGLNNVRTTALALSTITDAAPTLTGSYTLSFPVPHTSILGGSPATVSVTYYANVLGATVQFSSTAITFTENHLPTITSTFSVSTSTIPVQVTVRKCHLQVPIHLLCITKC